MLETERILLRRVTWDDVSLLFELDSDPDVIRYTDLGGRGTFEYRRDHTLPRWLAYYEQGEGIGYWIAVEKATGDFLGWFHFRPARDNPEDTELGYRLRKSAWGQGYATEVSVALIQKGFDEGGVTRVTATALAANAASIRVMQKAGLRFEKNYTYEFTDPNTGQTTGHPAVKYARARNEEAAARE